MRAKRAKLEARSLIVSPDILGVRSQRADEIGIEVVPPSIAEKLTEIPGNDPTLASIDSL